MKKYLKVIYENQISSDADRSGEIFGLSFVVLLLESQERLSQGTAKPAKLPVRTAKTQISLCICTILSAPSLSIRKLFWALGYTKNDKRRLTRLHKCDG